LFICFFARADPKSHPPYEQKKAAGLQGRQLFFWLAEGDWWDAPNLSFFSGYEYTLSHRRRVH
jgi:hypothetical protein